MLSRQINLDTYNRNIRVWFFEGMDEGLSTENLTYTGLANIHTIENPEDLVATFTGGGFYGRHGEMETARTYEWDEGWKFRPTPFIYKNAFLVPQTVLEYNANPPMVTDQVQMLGAYGIHTLDSLFVNMLNNAFTAGAHACYDGEALISDSHPLKNAPGVFSNKGTPAAFSQTSYAEVINYFLDVPNDDGMRFSMTPYAIIIHPSKLVTVTQVLDTVSDASVNNDGTPSITKVSPYARPKIFTSNKLTNPDAWFVICSPSELKSLGHGLGLHFTPQGRPDTYAKTMDDPKAIKHIGQFRVATLVSKIRGIFGNPGA